MTDSTARPRASQEDLLAKLTALDISHEVFSHPPVFTVEEAAATHGTIPGVHCKNLFLRDAKKKPWLVVCPFDRAIDMKALPDLIGSKRLSFGSADRLMEYLGVEPGSVTPFALINDPDHTVRVVLDAWMMEQPIVTYHPLVNTATVSLASGDLLRFIADCGHDPAIVDLRGMSA
ncbi:MAG: prolyl-tRNA synthetase associated domain-containing protein [Rhodospirillaceae bacterium]